jgi:hypothetical protein
MLLVSVAAKGMLLRPLVIDPAQLSLNDCCVALISSVSSRSKPLNMYRKCVQEAFAQPLHSLSHCMAVSLVCHLVLPAAAALCVTW